MSTIAKKYYWLKLKNDWFDSKIVKKLRRMAGGDTYTIIYLKMQLLSLKNEGRLYYEGIEESFVEELALDLNENSDDVKMTVAFLTSNGLLETLETDEFLLNEVPLAICSESESATRVRKYRQKAKALQCNGDVTECNGDVTKCNTDIDIELDIELEKDIDTCAEQKCSTPEPEPIITLPLNTGEEFPIFQCDLNEFAELYPAVDILQAMRGMRGWLITNPTRRKTKRGIRRFINSWLAKEQDKGGTRGYKNNTQSNSKSMTTEEYMKSTAGWWDDDK